MEFNLIELSEEMKMDFMSVIRLTRDCILADTDWTQLPDAPLTEEKRQEWISYRQYLRDITDGLTEPIDPIFVINTPPT